MRHIRTDSQSDNRRRVFACGVGPMLPAGDTYVFVAEVGLHHTVDCPGCLQGRRPLGTPITELSGRPGHLGYEKFKRIAESWGYE